VRSGPGPLPRAGLIAALFVAVFAAACPDGDRASGRDLGCPAIDGAAAITAAGVYRYVSAEFALSGTITFAQEGSLLRVTDTSYDTGNDRSLIGSAALAGNRLDIVLTPKNGDTNYTAQVSFVFSDGGRRFCLLGFSDTNGDTGQEASYLGAQVTTGTSR
jgi:hypothetical protein